MSTKRKKQEDFEILDKEVSQNEIILFNDDVHTFEFVINSLMDVCDHSPEQAEQCTYLVHYKGKCAVKTGEYDELKPRCSRLLNLGLSAEIV
ncbi:MAG: ATP-dependent Clp protease adaptor ClpS [Bacteroidia bacterium]|jgi:ATP-dependent Clp protease adaptor protein ClpS|nr:ATP-dependent Clp protease adaptor ClpS [Bacteroidia bacterium]MDH5415235.1 ATP-dependent Clp protease adaptor ClpS [Flavobacteriaceae bacterium]